MTMTTLAATARICLLSSNWQMTLSARAATPEDAARIAQIYNEGIEDRVGTFETRPRSEADVRAWFDGRHPIVVVEDGSRIAAFASTSTYRARECYAGIAEFSVYVAGHRRSAGAGQVAMTALREAAEAAGYWKLLSRIFPEIPPAERSWRRWDSMKSASIGGTESWTVCGETV